ncbi:hypothetical protein HanIR_Chr00c29g0911951 [Helianthus annuus]|nr:hypothetical protein HanIR_Chr00c29g0911951 [Helianthus annuus]
MAINPSIFTHQTNPSTFLTIYVCGNKFDKQAFTVIYLHETLTWQPCDFNPLLQPRSSSCQTHHHNQKVKDQALIS